MQTLRDIILKFGDSGDLYEKLLPYRDVWNTTDEVLKSLVDAKVSKTCLKQFISDGLDVDRDIDGYIPIAYAALHHIPHFYLISVHVCISYRDQPMVQRYINMYVYSVLCYFSNCAGNEINVEESYVAWMELFEREYRLMLHVSQFKAVLGEIRVTSQSQ